MGLRKMMSQELGGIYSSHFRHKTKFIMYKGFVYAVPRHIIFLPLYQAKKNQYKMFKEWQHFMKNMVINEI